MKIALFLTIMLFGQTHPDTKMFPMPDLKTCEKTAHGFLTFDFKKKVLFRAAACGIGDPTAGQDVGEKE